MRRPPRAPAGVRSGRNSPGGSRSGGRPRGAGSSPSRSSWSRRKASIGFRARPGSRMAGTGGRAIGRRLHQSGPARRASRGLGGRRGPRTRPTTGTPRGRRAGGRGRAASRRPSTFSNQQALARVPGDDRRAVLAPLEGPNPAGVRSSAPLFGAAPWQARQRSARTSRTRAGGSSPRAAVARSPARASETARRVDRGVGHDLGLPGRGRGRVGWPDHRIRGGIRQRFRPGPRGSPRPAPPASPGCRSGRWRR